MPRFPRLQYLNLLEHDCNYNFHSIVCTDAHVHELAVLTELKELVGTCTLHLPINLSSAI